MFRNLANSLIKHESITTTLPKAKALRKVIEPLITLSKISSLSNKRLVFSRLRDRSSVQKLFDTIGPRHVNRPGGYTRILKKGYRSGDSAPLAFMQILSEENVVEDLKETKSTK
jgi:large subunit ribosomal protein L17